MTLPLDLAIHPIGVPRGTPLRGVQEPDWSDYRVQVPRVCDHCIEAAYETQQAGGGWAGVRHARRKRKHGKSILLLCSEHAQIQRQKDEEAQ